MLPHHSLKRAFGACHIAKLLDLLQVRSAQVCTCHTLPKYMTFVLCLRYPPWLCIHAHAVMCAVFPGVVVVATSNKPWRIESALLRPGRLGLQICVPVPDACSRLAVVKECATNVPLDDGVNLQQMVSWTKGWSCAEVKYTFQEATRIAAQRSKSGHVPVQLCQQDILDSFNLCATSAGGSSMHPYVGWARK